MILTHLALGPGAEFPTLGPSHWYVTLIVRGTPIPPDGQQSDPFSSLLYLRVLLLGFRHSPSSHPAPGRAPLCLEFLFAHRCNDFHGMSLADHEGRYSLSSLPRYLAQCPGTEYSETGVG